LLLVVAPSCSSTTRSAVTSPLNTGLRYEHPSS
jgi:hypothetical protein